MLIAMKSLVLLCWFVCLVGWSFNLVPNVHAEMVTVTPSADTTLHEKSPDFNVGGHFDFSAGTVASGQRTRALVKFDLTGKVPANATILSARLVLRFTREPSSGGADGILEVRRVLRTWTEGNKPGPSGQPATSGETTWSFNMHPGLPWAEKGGGFGSDFSSTTSASVPIIGRGTLEILSTRALLADVQAWLADPTANFGWVLAVRDESVRETARRIASREDPANAPKLILEYTLGPAELRFAPATTSATHLLLAWTGGTPPFQVQHRPSLEAGTWMDLGKPTTNRNVEIPRASAPGYYRLQLATTTQNPDNPPPPPPADPNETVEYELSFQSDWTPSTHPQSYPLGAHWSPLIGGTHNEEVVFWEAGGLASRGIEDMAEVGSVVNLRQEINAVIAVGKAFQTFTRPGSIPPSGTVSVTFTVHRKFPRVTAVTMIAPSPDWFTGVHGVLLRENDQWVDKKTVVLNLYDAGTDSGANYNSLDADTQPRSTIRQILGFPALVGGNVVPFGSFTFTRKR